MVIDDRMLHLHDKAMRGLELTDVLLNLRRWEQEMEAATSDSALLDRERLTR
jgi:hypothetical protein